VAYKTRLDCDTAELGPSAPFIPVDPKPPVHVNIDWPYILIVVVPPLLPLDSGAPPDPPLPIVKSITWPLATGIVIFCKHPLLPPPPPDHGPVELDPDPDPAPPPPPPIASMVRVVMLDGTVLTAQSGKKCSSR